MKVLNRAALVVRPRAPYLTWAAGVDDESPTAAESLAERMAIYLVPEDPDGQNKTGPLEWFYEEVFEAELEAWTTDEDLWPRDRTLEMFLEWFEIQGESLVLDLGTDDLEIEDY